jgi:hypothetical protein
MKIENQCFLTLDETDVKKCACNGGTKVDLPPGTVAVVVRVAWQEREEGK